MEASFTLSYRTSDRFLVFTISPYQMNPVKIFPRIVRVHDLPKISSLEKYVVDDPFEQDIFIFYGLVLRVCGP